MLWSDIATLIRYTESINIMGDMERVETEIPVFVNAKSIRQNEYYQALSAGLKPAIMFEIRAIDYNNEKNIIYKGNAYIITRTYSKNTEIIELICEEVI